MEGLELLTKQYYRLEDSLIFRNKKELKLDFDIFPYILTKPLVEVLPSRLLNISYGDYLRFCSSVLHAEIVGKNQRYPVVLFERTALTKIFVELLNVRLNYIFYLEKRNKY